jgi:hypothetical protein
MTLSPLDSVIFLFGFLKGNYFSVSKAVSNTFFDFVCTMKALLVTATYIAC